MLTALLKEIQEKCRCFDGVEKTIKCKNMSDKTSKSLSRHGI